MASSLIDTLLALQLFVVLFICLHDWVPLGALNDVRAVQAADSRSRLVAVTAFSTLPFAIGFAASVYYAGQALPHWLLWWLWLSYGGAAWGMLRAWWIPYLLVRSPARAARYQAMFSKTHTLLPERNGIRPDTLHLTLHAAIVAIVILLAVISCRL